MNGMDGHPNSPAKDRKNEKGDAEAIERRQSTSQQHNDTRGRFLEDRALHRRSDKRQNEV